MKINTRKLPDAVTLALNPADTDSRPMLSETSRVFVFVMRKEGTTPQESVNGGMTSDESDSKLTLSPHSSWLWELI